MKKIYVIIILIFLSTTVFPQYSLRAGMGIDFASSPSLTDYINQNFAPSNNQLGTFHAAIVFSGEAGFMAAENYEIGIEVAYLLNSFNYASVLGNYDFEYNIIMPTLTSYYVISGSGYNFKFGGGLGVRLVNVDEKLPGRAVTDNYTSTGFGILLRADGNTLLGGNVYANIGFDIRYDLNGKPKNSDTYIRNNIYDEDVSLNSFSAGLRLGVSYIF
jgi:hypothetical protein